MTVGPGSVAIISEHSLVAQSVCAALTGHGLRGTVLRWPHGTDRPPSALPVAGVLLCDLEPAERLAELRWVLQHWSSRWVVLTGTQRQPLWGAALAAGAASVLPETTSLDELVVVLSRLLAGRPVMAERDRQELIGSWLGWLMERQRLEERMQLLSPRERDVLEMLHRGESVREIAGERGVSEATVRFQVRTILRKLEVSSQLAAVAAFDSRRTAALHFSE